MLQGFLTMFAVVRSDISSTRLSVGGALEQNLTTDQVGHQDMQRTWEEWIAFPHGQLLRSGRRGDVYLGISWDLLDQPSTVQ